jgi:hypothetical protein
VGLDRLLRRRGRCERTAMGGAGHGDGDVKRGQGLRLLPFFVAANPTGRGSYRGGSQVAVQGGSLHRGVALTIRRGVTVRAVAVYPGIRHIMALRYSLRLDALCRICVRLWLVALHNLNFTYDLNFTRST